MYIIHLPEDEPGIHFVVAQQKYIETPECMLP